jgi:hypothetical protein
VHAVRGCSLCEVTASQHASAVLCKGVYSAGRVLEFVHACLRRLLVQHRISVTGSKACRHMPRMISWHDLWQG